MRHLPVSTHQHRLLRPRRVYSTHTQITHTATAEHTLYAAYVVVQLQVCVVVWFSGSLIEWMCGWVIEWMYGVDVWFCGCVDMWWCSCEDAQNKCIMGKLLESWHCRPSVPQDAVGWVGVPIVGWGSLNSPVMCLTLMSQPRAASLPHCSWRALSEACFRSTFCSTVSITTHYTALQAL